MIKIEKGGDITEIQRLVRKSNDYGTFDSTNVSVVYISKFESIDEDYGGVRKNFTIFINSNLAYKIFGASSISVIRDSKLNTILNDNN